MRSPCRTRAGRIGGPGRDLGEVVDGDLSDAPAQEGGELRGDRLDALAVPGEGPGGGEPGDLHPQRLAALVAELEHLGQLELASFVNQAGLEAIGSNLLMETEASGAAFVGTPSSDGLGSTLQGYLESSNVNPVQEITALIATQRAYDLNSKVISASDEMLATVTHMS